MQQIHFEEYDLDVDKQAVADYWKARCFNEEKNESISSGPIEWFDLVFESREEAYDYATSQEGNGRKIAIKFKTDEILKHSPEYKKIKREIKKNKQIINKIDSKIYYSSKNCSSKFKTCRTYKSRISTRFIRNNFCPVCSKDLRPESVVEKLRELNSLVNKLQVQLMLEEKKDKEKGLFEKGLKWLVKVEY